MRHSVAAEPDDDGAGLRVGRNDRQTMHASPDAARIQKLDERGHGVAGGAGVLGYLERERARPCHVDVQSPADDTAALQRERRYDRRG